MTTEEQLSDIKERLKVIQIESHFQTFAVILALLGIVTLHQLFKGK